MLLYPNPSDLDESLSMQITVTHAWSVQLAELNSNHKLNTVKLHY